MALAKEGIKCDLIDPRTTSPLDAKTILESVENTGRLIVVDESPPRCSVASDIAAMVASRGFESLQAPVEMVTPPHSPVPFSPGARARLRARAAEDRGGDPPHAREGADEPSMQAVTMPKWGIEMTEGTVNSWTAHEGQVVEKGDAAAGGRDRQDRQHRGGTLRRHAAAHPRRRPARSTPWAA